MDRRPSNPGRCSRLARRDDESNGARHVLLTDSAFDEDVVRRASVVEVLGTKVVEAIPEELFLMKLEANRPIDLDDVIAIKDAFADRLDLTYVRKQADGLGPDVRQRLDLILP